MEKISQERARNALINFCGDWISRHPNIYTQITIVFDGNSSVAYQNLQYPRNVHVQYTSTGMEADQKIIEMTTEKRTVSYVVVTNDLDLIQKIRHQNAEHVSVDDFFSISEKSRPSSVPVREDKDLPLNKQKEITKELEKLWGD